MLKGLFIGLFIVLLFGGVVNGYNLNYNNKSIISSDFKSNETSHINDSKVNDSDFEHNFDVKLDIKEYEQEIKSDDRGDEDKPLAIGIRNITNNIICSNCALNLSNLTNNTNFEEEEEGDEEAGSNISNEKIYVYGLELVATKDNNGLDYYNQNYLGSNVFSVDDEGELTGKRISYLYGADFENVGTREAIKNRYKFIGREQDDFQIYYFGSRYYQPTTGRFISVDPRGSIASYDYALSNPLKYVDPNGQEVQFASNIKERASSVINFLAKRSYSVRDIKNSDYIVRYAQVDDLKESTRLFGIDPLTFENIEPKYGYTDKSLRVFLREGQDKVTFLHTLTHESMHAFALTQDRELVLNRHTDRVYSLLDELRVELKLKYELGLDRDYDESVWGEVGFDDRDYKNLQRINERQINWYVNKLHELIGKDSDKHFEVLDEYVRKGTVANKKIY